MKLRNSDSPIQRAVIAIGAGVAIIAFFGWVFFLSNSPSATEKVNGVRIVAAAQAYTHALKAAKTPIPVSVQLDELVSRGLLRPADVAAFHGLDAAVLLTGPDLGPKTVLMRVRLPDGTDLELLADGTVQQKTR
jgi:hypothetical protein